jgi:hypothetical protein
VDDHPPPYHLHLARFRKVHLDMQKTIVILILIKACNKSQIQALTKHIWWKTLWIRNGMQKNDRGLENSECILVLLCYQFSAKKKKSIIINFGCHLIYQITTFRHEPTIPHTRNWPMPFPANTKP